MFNQDRYDSLKEELDNLMDEMDAIMFSESPESHYERGPILAEEIKRVSNLVDEEFDKFLEEVDGN